MQNNYPTTNFVYTICKFCCTYWLFGMYLFVSEDIHNLCFSLSPGLTFPWKTTTNVIFLGKCYIFSGKCYVFQQQRLHFSLWDSFWLPGHVIQKMSRNQKSDLCTEKCNICHQKCNICHGFKLSFKTMTQTQTQVKDTQFFVYLP